MTRILSPQGARLLRVQDVRQLEVLIYETVNDYLTDTECYQHPVLAMYCQCGNVNVVEDDTTEADIDEVSRVAN